MMIDDDSISLASMMPTLIKFHNIGARESADMSGIINAS